MSYILDALRRAEADRARERGKVPGLHDPTPAAAPTPSFDAGTTRRGAWIGGGVAVVLGVAAIAWALKDRGDSAPVVASAGPSIAGATNGPSTATAPTRAVTASPSPSPSPSLSSSPSLSTPPATAESTPPSALSGGPAAPAPAPPPGTPAPSPAVAPPRELTSVPALPHGDSAPRPTPSATTTPSTAAASTAAAARIYESSELPDDIRRALPPLTFGGAMYSDNASARLLIVNGQVAHEGDPVAKGVVLEQIRLKTAVLVFRGYRYSVSF